MSSFKSWVIAARLRTLPLAFSGWLIGTVLAYDHDQMDWLIATLTLLTAFLLQILSNFANDYGDAVSGVDSETRQGPSRMVQSGSITKKAMGRAMVITALLSFISGSVLLYVAFPSDFLSAMIFLVLGLLGIAAAIKYTVGKNPYGYAGFGDLFVFLFFGLVLVFGTYFLQAKSFNLTVILPSISIGLFSIGVLNVNNIRDIASDKASGKNSIPVRIGKRKAALYHAFLLGGGMVTAVGYSLLEFESWTQFIFLLVGVLLFKNTIAVLVKPSSELDPYLKQMALSTLLFSILFSIGILIA